MAVDVEIDVELLKTEIKKTYACVSDASQPRDRARLVGVYRFWRDFGFVIGALIAGIGADVTSAGTAIVIVAAITAASGLVVGATAWPARPALQPAHAP